jgi:hypothetical protein
MQSATVRAASSPAGAARMEAAMQKMKSVQRGLLCIVMRPAEPWKFTIACLAACTAAQLKKRN